MKDTFFKKLFEYEDSEVKEELFMRDSDDFTLIVEDEDIRGFKQMDWKMTVDWLNKRKNERGFFAHSNIRSPEFYLSDHMETVKKILKIVPEKLF